MSPTTIESIITDNSDVLSAFKEIKKLISKAGTHDALLEIKLNNAFNAFVSRVARHGNAAICEVQDLNLESQVSAFIEELLEEEAPTFLVGLPFLMGVTEEGVETQICDLGHIDPYNIESVKPAGTVLIHDVSNGEEEERPFCRVRMSSGEEHLLLMDGDEFSELINRLRGFDPEDE